MKNVDTQKFKTNEILARNLSQKGDLVGKDANLEMGMQIMRSHASLNKLTVGNFKTSFQTHETLDLSNLKRSDMISVPQKMS